MFMKCSKIVHPTSLNSVFRDILKDTKLSVRECELIGNTEVDTDEYDSLLGLVEDRIRNLLENRREYNSVLTCEDLQIRFAEWTKVNDNLLVDVWDWLQYEIDAKGIQIIQHPNPEGDTILSPCHSKS